MNYEQLSLDNTHIYFQDLALLTEKGYEEFIEC